MLGVDREVGHSACCLLYLSVRLSPIYLSIYLHLLILQLVVDLAGRLVLDLRGFGSESGLGLGLGCCG